MEEITPNEDYMRGINDAYIIKKYLPQIADSLAKAVGNSDRGSGFQDWVKQDSPERSGLSYPSWLKSDRLESAAKNDTDREKDIERERG